MTKILCGECIHNSDKGGGCLIPKNLGYVDNCNRYLPKDRPIVQTNEEYLRSATTEQLADVLLEHFEWGLSINAEYCFTEKYVEQNREHILEWLKQPHREE